MFVIKIYVIYSKLLSLCLILIGLSFIKVISHPLKSKLLCRKGVKLLSCEQDKKHSHRGQLMWSTEATRWILGMLANRDKIFWLFSHRNIGASKLCTIMNTLGIHRRFSIQSIMEWGEGKVWEKPSRSLAIVSTICTKNNSFNI